MAKEQRNMTKADIVTEIASRTGVDKAVIRVIIEAWMQIIKESLIQGFVVQLRGFGSFFRKQRASKKARNISKNITIVVPAHEVPAYKPSKDFVNEIKNG